MIDPQFLSDNKFAFIAFGVLGIALAWFYENVREFIDWKMNHPAPSLTSPDQEVKEAPAAAVQPELTPLTPAPLDTDLLRAEITLRAERDRKIAEAAAVRKQRRKEKAAEMISSAEQLRPKDPTPPGHYPMAGSSVGRITITNSIKGEGVSWDVYEAEEIAKVRANALYCSLNTPEEIERFKTPEAKQEFYCNHARIDAMVRAIKEWEKRDD
ncbi:MULTISPECIES: hypothetical protein [unclassified Sphingopyxis]|uniref:hypothetical protein n=1 Tax=Alphaproteobacteria TaxID=28211 RepID=UPI00285C4B23|nr:MULTISPECIES: hypothetical protein [unclassified Sphingopyxis]MDR7061924.1 hypothetical protein [Sphingopyxis sp. BE235]MDR7182131.1 hypothetical protein [Sphingopyxis sp. BE249]